VAHSAPPPVSEIAECRLKRRIELLSPAEQRVQLQGNGESLVLCVGKAFTAKIPLRSREASSFARTALNVVGGAIGVVVIHVGASTTAKAALFLFRRSLLRCSRRMPSVILREGITAASHCRVDNVRLVATGPGRALGRHVECSCR
jgi:hypothetical protein